jgi:hypothetical protein
MAYDQNFFLALAAQGKNAWNEWRRDPANNDVRVTFARIDFSGPPRDQIDFSGFEFGDHADFLHCRWRGTNARRPAALNARHRVMPRKVAPRTFRAGAARFTGAIFGIGTNFNGAAFGDAASFNDATFKDVDFAGASFGAKANFSGKTEFKGDVLFIWATFGSASNFAGASFGGTAKFTGAAFGDEVNFTRVAFSSGVEFNGAAFGWGADFNQTHFKSYVAFTGMSEQAWTNEFELQPGMSEEDRAAVKIQHKEIRKRYDAGPDCFRTISCSNARFDDEAIFTGRSFEWSADFTNAHFYYPPDFDGATNAARIDFTGAHIGYVRPGEWHWTKDTQVSLRLRTLRKIAEETKNHDLERDLYIEERKAERGVIWRRLLEERARAPEELQKKLEDITNQKKDAWSEWRLQARARIAHILGIVGICERFFSHLLWIIVMGVYWALADYGRSFVQPFAWLATSVFFFDWRYTKVLAPLMAKVSPSDLDKYKQALSMLALGNAVPFVGPLTIDGEIKKFLFCLHDTTCTPIPPEGYQLLVVGQNLFSITCVFFIGLALRNYFKIK